MLVFFDIDGTIWDYRCEIPKSTIEGIRELRKNGHRAFLCSGRSKGAITDEKLLNIGFDGIVAGGGSYVEYNDEIIYENIIDWTEISRLTSVLNENRIPYIFEARDCIYVSEEFFGEDEYIAFLKKSLAENFKDYTEIKENNLINKLSVDFKNFDRDFIMEIFRDYETVLHRQGDYAEFMPEGCTKGSGILKVCEFLNDKVENTFAFGDSANDLEMFKTVNTAIAMGNAVDIAKDAADYITTDMHDDGIYNALKHFGLI